MRGVLVVKRNIKADASPRNHEMHVRMVDRVVPSPGVQPPKKPIRSVPMNRLPDASWRIVWLPQSNSALHHPQRLGHRERNEEVRHRQQLRGPPGPSLEPQILAHPGP